MQFERTQSAIDIIFGPMFSGKTTQLVQRLIFFSDAGFKTIYVNSELDTRDGILSTHNETLTISSSIAQIKAKTLKEIVPLLEGYAVIGIDESQFFPDLYDMCVELTEKYNKKIIVAGLNGDFKRNPFGQINSLIPICDTITKLFPFCKNCIQTSNKLEPALFSKRINAQSQEAVIDIGANDKYIPVCRKCY